MSPASRDCWTRMLPSGAIMIGQPNGAGTSLPLINQFMNQPLVYIRNPTSAFNSNFDVSSPGLQTYAFLQQNNNSFQLQPQGLNHFNLLEPFEDGGLFFFSVFSLTSCYWFQLYLSLFLQQFKFCPVLLFTNCLNPSNPHLPTFQRINMQPLRG